MDLCKSFCAGQYLRVQYCQTTPYMLPILTVTWIFLDTLLMVSAVTIKNTRYGIVSQDQKSSAYGDLGSGYFEMRKYTMSLCVFSSMSVVGRKPPLSLFVTQKTARQSFP